MCLYGPAVEYFGHRIDAEGLHPTNGNVAAIIRAQHRNINISWPVEQPNLATHISRLLQKGLEGGALQSKKNAAIFWFVFSLSYQTVDVMPRPTGNCQANVDTLNLLPLSECLNDGSWRSLELNGSFSTIPATADHI